MLTSSFKNAEKNNNPTGQGPILTTSAVSSVTSNSATCGGYISCDNGSTTTVRGVCWSTGTTPTIADSKTTDGLGAGSFTSYISGLRSNTIYYVRAYATNSDGTGYGNAISFTTSASRQTLTDIDGNIYHMITIGTQVWMVENLKVTKYRNGDPIPNVTDDKQWGKLTTGAYCYYENSLKNGKTYGNLYNWYAINDSRNIAPTGWHIPSDSEWTVLTEFLGGEADAGGKLKSTSGWAYNNFGATNITGFTALPGGSRDADGASGGIWYGGGWWSSPTAQTDTPWDRGMSYNYSNVYRSTNHKQVGFSVRCVKDK